MPPATPEPTRGYVAAATAYLLWGLVLPFFLKTVEHVSPAEIVAHRAVWSLPLAVGLLAYGGRLLSMAQFLNPGMIARAMLCAAIISVNWGVYVYAIGAGRAVDTALGYYINPLVSLLLAAVFLGERPSRLQGAAIALAAFGVLVLTIATGGLPWISLVLALSFGTYGLLRKVMPFGATEGFFMEVVLLLPFMLAVIAWKTWSGTAAFGAGTSDTLLLLLAGPLTAIPLILYASAARLLRLSTIGIMQFSVPTLLFLNAVFVFREPFGRAQLLSFCFIWAALGLYVWTLLLERRSRRQTGA